MIRIILLAILIGTAYYLIKSMNNCDYCKGEGSWKGTRGERNFCKRCNGTGRKY